MDFLSEVKDSIESKKLIQFEEGSVRIDNKVFECSDKTKFIKRDGSQTTVADIYFAMYHVLENKELEYSAYYQEAEERKLLALDALERNALIEYITGSKKICEFISDDSLDLANNIGIEETGLYDVLLKYQEINSVTCISSLAPRAAKFKSAHIRDVFDRVFSAKPSHAPIICKFHGYS